MPGLSYRYCDCLVLVEGICLVKITLIPSGLFAHGASNSQYATSYVINNTVAIDAGSIGFYEQPRDQAAIRHVFLSHTHMDHLASLPTLLENIADLSETPVTLHASEEVQQCLRLDLFNGRLWANFLDLTHDNKPFVVVRTIASGQSVEVDGLRITPVAVDHIVPTLGFIIEDGSAAVVIPSDTGPTEEIWRRASQTPNLKAVFLEATFPDDMGSLADLTKHHTPASFIREMEKLPRPVPFFAVHLKARFREQLTRELLAHRPTGLQIAKIGTTYEF
jgi:ribonuclease BN (tRNA processing enzyme)